MRPAHVLCDIRLQRAQSNYSVFKVREVFALTNQLGNFFRFVRSFFEIFQKKFFDHLSGTKKAPITSQRCNRGRNRKNPLTEISGLKSYELIVCYRNLSAIAEFQTHFWRKLGVNWRKLWRKHRQFWGNQYSLAPAGMWSSTIRRWSFSSPSSS